MRGAEASIFSLDWNESTDTMITVGQEGRWGDGKFEAPMEIQACRRTKSWGNKRCTGCDAVAPALRAADTKEKGHPQTPFFRCRRALSVRQAAFAPAD